MGLKINIFFFGLFKSNIKNLYLINFVKHHYSYIHLTYIKYNKQKNLLKQNLKKCIENVYKKQYIFGDNMKKFVILMGIIMSLILIYNNEKDYLIIPNEAIRVRVIANSDLESDIKIKEKVKDDLNKEVYSLLEGVESINDARNILNNNINNINKTVDKSLKNLNYDKNFNINYGLNYFPEKSFNGVKYDSGYYESLVVTLGNGNGSNYWCVLYPPLCLIEEKSDNVHYKSYIKELLNKYL